MAFSRFQSGALCIVLGCVAGAGALYLIQHSNAPNAPKAAPEDFRRDAIWSATQACLLAQLKFSGSATFPEPPLRTVMPQGLVRLGGSKWTELGARKALAEGKPEEFKKAKANDYNTSTIKEYDSEVEVDSWVDAPNAFGAKQHLRFILILKAHGDKWECDKLDFLWVDEP